MHIQDSSDCKGGEPGGRKGFGWWAQSASRHWLEERHMEGGVDVERQLKFQPHHRGINHPIKGIWTNKPGGELSGVHLQGDVP